MSCHKQLPPPPPPHHHDCHDHHNHHEPHEHCHEGYHWHDGHHRHHCHYEEGCGCIEATSKSAESASASAKAAADSAVLAQKILQNCLTDKTIMPGGGLVYVEGTPPGEGGIIVDIPAIINQGMGLGIDQNGDIYVKLGIGLGYNEQGAIYVKLKEGYGLIWDNEGRIAFNPSGLINQGNGLVIGPDGKIQINIGNGITTDGDGRLVINLYEIIGSNSGLQIGSDGKLIFNPDNMDDTRLNAMLSRLRLPQWLGANLDLYVNRTSDGDSIVDKRGTSAKPFKTIQAAVNYACENYNVCDFTLTIHVASGTYDEHVALKSYDRMNGIMRLVGAGKSSTTISRGLGITRAKWDASGIGVDCSTSSGVIATIYCDEAATLNIADVSAKMTQNTNVYCECIHCGNNSSISIGSGCSMNAVAAAGESKIDGIVAFRGGQVGLDGAGAFSVSGSYRTTVRTSNNGVFSRSSGTNPTMSGSASGQRFDCSTGSGINTLGAGDSFIPGSSPGNCDTNSGAWYL